jgi:Xaa-Pro aminopeptidase
MAALGALRPGVYEYEIEAVLRYVFRKHGSPRPGYPPIVASGPNATVLHYTTNDRLIEDGDLLLIDAGTEYGYLRAT